MFELGIASGMLLTALLNLLLQAIGVCFANCFLLYVILCLPKIKELYGATWGHLILYDKDPKPTNKIKSNRAFQLQATSRGEFPGGC